MNGAIGKVTCEAIGTFALTFIGGGAIVTGAWSGGEPGLIGIALAHGLVLSIVVSATMNISGGHINPAVTAAMLVTGRIRAPAALAYVLGQCGGAVAAGLLLLAVFQFTGEGPAGISGLAAIEQSALGTPHFVPARVSPGLAVLIEAALTFLLVFSVFGTAVDKRAPNVGGFGIGLTVGVDILMGGPLTGAAMNPARTIGTLVGGGGATASLWSQHWVYWVGPIVGGVLAAWVYDGLILKKAEA